MRIRLLVLISLVALPALAAWGGDKHSWELQNQYWGELNPSSQPTTLPQEEPVLDDADRLIVNGHPGKAKHLLLKWEANHKNSPARDRCIYLIAEASYQDNNRIRAFYYLDELMDEYAASVLYQTALQKQFDIAEDYLNGYCDTFLGLAILDETDAGIAMMFRIQQRSPGSPLAEKALMKTANFYFDNQDFDFAADAYKQYVRSYPRSAQVPMCRLKAAQSSLAQYHGVPFDVTTIIDARAQLLDIIRDYPTLAREHGLTGIIANIDNVFARKILWVAEYYERTHEPKAAVYHYRFLVRTYPDAPEAITARERLASMSPDKLKEPPPPMAKGYAPSTQPSNQ